MLLLYNCSDISNEDATLQNCTKLSFNHIKKFPYSLKPLCSQNVIYYFVLLWHTHFNFPVSLYLLLGLNGDLFPLAAGTKIVNTSKTNTCKYYWIIKNIWYIYPINDDSQAYVIKYNGRGLIIFIHNTSCLRWVIPIVFVQYKIIKCVLISQNILIQLVHKSSRILRPLHNPLSATLYHFTGTGTTLQASLNIL
jgi:hypothetical protein